MTKKLIALALLVAALLIGSYYPMGYMAEKAIQKNIGVINQTKELQVKLADYKRNWFSSTAMLTWTLTTPDIMTKDAKGKLISVPGRVHTFDMPVTVLHGPIMLSSDGLHAGLGYAYSDIKLSDNYLDQLNSYFVSGTAVPMVKFNVLVRFFNQIQFKLTVPEFTLISKKDKSQIKWLGFTSAMKMSTSGDSYKGKVHFEGVNVHDGLTVLTFDNIKTRYNLHKTPNQLYLGSAKVSMKHFDIKHAGETLILVDDFKAVTESDTDDNLFKSTVDASLGQLQYNDNKFNNIELDLSFKNIDAQALGDINQQLSRINQLSGAEKGQAFVTLLGSLPTLVHKGTAIEIKTLKMDLPDGKVDGNFVLSVPVAKVSNPFELIQRLMGKGQLKLSMKIFEQYLYDVLYKRYNTMPSLQHAKATTNSSVKAEPKLPQNQKAIDARVESQVRERIVSLVRNGTIVKKDNNVIFNIKLNDGQLTVNGKPFNPSMFIGVN